MKVGAGLGPGAAAGGGFAFTGKSKHKTVGPSRVNFRKIARPGAAGTLTVTTFNPAWKLKNVDFS